MESSSDLPLDILKKWRLSLRGHGCRVLLPGPVSQMTQSGATRETMLHDTLQQQTRMNPNYREHRLTMASIE
ncbi:hypothetical protein N9B17_01680 [Rhodopirellula sp.]|nr:hypothetical protein [Rhodopirellula sp.]